LIDEAFEREKALLENPQKTKPFFFHGTNTSLSQIKHDGMLFIREERETIIETNCFNCFDHFDAKEEELFLFLAAFHSSMFKNSQK
jgi:hypothetical protein